MSLIFNNDLEIDSLKEIFSMGLGKAADSLSKLTCNRVMLEVPSVLALLFDDVQKFAVNVYKKWAVGVNQCFEGSLSGKAVIVFHENSGRQLLNLICREDVEQTEKFTEADSQTIMEIGNIIISALVGVASNFIYNKSRVRWLLPCFCQDLNDKLFMRFFEDDYNSQIIIIETEMKILDKSISGNIILFFDFSSLEFIKEKLTDLIS